MESKNGVLTKEAARRKLYQKWWWIKENYPCTPDFLDFKKFYDWAMKSGWDGKANLKRFNECDPFDVENCYWDFPDETDRDKEIQKSIAAWNNTVNRIRKHYGMPPVEEMQRSEEDV